ncbi:MAG: PAS domain-containing protein [Acidobacteria bacterium]|nr:PAS domain-containing protein [Candidatus Sulfomarinibacter kjeldsenii]
MSAVTQLEDVRARIFDEIPSGVVLVDPSLTIIDHNRAFADLFGEARGSSCYAATKGRRSPCSSCPALETFSDGHQRVIEQQGKDSNGREVHYLVQITPVMGADNRPEYVAAITTDLTATRRLQREYKTLFEQVPCFVAVINRDHRVVKGNELFRKTFGEPTGEHCYRLYKRRREPCQKCPVDRTFADGLSHASRQMGMARDLDAIVVFDEKQKVLLVNQAAEDLLGCPLDEMIGRPAPKRRIPKALYPVLKGRENQVLLHETAVTNFAGERIPVRIAAVALEVDGKFGGAALIAQDLRELKRLELEKMEAERLAAVGQTVAGLAHGIKNILTGLEGGMYVTSSGLKRGDEGRVHQGWEMLERNMGRISDLARSLLAFSRGEALTCREISPADVVNDVVELYRDGASQQGIELSADVDDGVAPAWMDPEALHSCLANLVSNAVDACLVSGSSGCRVEVRVRESDGVLVFEVVDTGCGMDYEVKQKAFTSFFTTKERGGTGLGLLLTRKIVQQHGGSIVLETEQGEGTTFRLEFPRDRLPKPETEEE